MPFDDLYGPGYLEIMKRRLRGEFEELVWPRQVRDLVRPHLREGTTILEVGCCVGTAYRAFEATGVKYIGLDYEPKYLRIAKKWYQDNPDVSFIEHDITKGPSPQVADIVICSAMLEHCSGFQLALRYMTDAVKRFIILRTFLGEKEDIAYNIASNKELAYVNQYAFQDILGYLAGRGFAVTVHRDRYTQSIPQLQNGVIRTFYIVFGETAKQRRG